jgi:hypothetical protein
MLESQTGTPFKLRIINSAFQDSSGENRIRTFKNNPNKIVRVDAFEGRKVQEIIEEYSMARSLFEELHTKYGFDIPSIEYVIGQSPQKVKSIFTITDKIHGTDLYRLSPGSQTSSEKDRIYSLLATHYDALSGYYTDKYRHGGKYLSDLKNSQWVLGKRSGETADRIYLVDLDPYYDEYDSLNPTKQQAEDFYHDLLQVYVDIYDMEEKFPDYYFDTSRHSLRTLLVSMASGDSFYKELRKYRSPRSIDI